MRIASRLSNLSLILLLCLSMAPAALAERRAVEHRRERAPVTPREVAPREAMPKAKAKAEAEVHENRDERRTNELRRGCRSRDRHLRLADCDYYYDDDDDPDAGSGGQPTSSPQPVGEPSAPAAAKLAPAAPGPEAAEHTFTPEGNHQVKEKLIAGRKNWLRKKSQLDDINTAVARSEYQSEQTGVAVDRRLLAEQKKAQQEAEEAHAALSPLIEEAREAGISEHLIELYMRSNDGL